MTACPTAVHSRHGARQAGQLLLTLQSLDLVVQLLKLSILLRAAVQRLLSNTVGAGLQLGPQIVYLPAALVTSAC